jgi:acetyl-CoA carboxylase / biotin carboxylase 1
LVSKVSFPIYIIENPQSHLKNQISSAFKTAQAIHDFNKGEQLPLIIFANWRGFSGGQSDMYKEVLKYGAHIVDALRTFKQPVFIYVIGELRGGAWVVLDPTINPEMMELYAEKNSRGGVLEPEGIVEIKFRKPQLLAAMERLDETYRNLKALLKDTSLSPEERASLQNDLNAREHKLLPVFHQVSVQFADLHDRPGRMLAKGAIKSVVEWHESRTFFYWRLLRRISEDSVIREIQKADEALEWSAARSVLESWHLEDDKSAPRKTVLDMCDDDDEVYHNEDEEFVTWLNTHRSDIARKLAILKKETLKCKVQAFINSEPQLAMEEFLATAKKMDSDRRKALRALLDE